MSAPDRAAPAVDPITAAALVSLAGQSFNERYLLGYLGAGLRSAVANHPDDDSLRRDLAMYEAWAAHQDEQVAEARARHAEARARVEQSGGDPR